MNTTVKLYNHRSHHNYTSFSLPLGRCSCYYFHAIRRGSNFAWTMVVAQRKPEGGVLRVLPLGGERNPPSLSHNSNLIILEASNG